MKSTHYWREVVAEFWGTLFLVLLGNGSVASAKLSQGADEGWFAVGYGIGVTVGVLIALNTSGGHINPAVTVALAVTGKFPWKKVPGFVLAQFLGGFVSGPLLYMTCHGIIEKVEEGSDRTERTRGIFATYPADGVGIWEGFADQVIGTFILCSTILALADSKKGPFVKGMLPFLVGLTVTGIILSFGFVAGAGINPARDFGPRVFTAIVGYEDVFSAGDYFFWIPLVGPFVGAIAAALLFPSCFGFEPSTADSD
ncbi:unnamed protein product [Cyprideis torosa]|uniref:Uncharacterized protein n=1 Tax=Cyprideis torosa TaxID=163714 RepID=A0A7R8W9D3_9CRUS|nr:unnamed protein product [Cyprideis torosa]CAG0889675.1 unnamed protein product [Cyprideis torosa]